LRRGAKMKSDGWSQPAGKEVTLYAGNTPQIAGPRGHWVIDPKLTAEGRDSSLRAL